MKKIGMRRCV